MDTIFKRALSAYDDGGTDIMWTYLDRLIMTGVIEEGQAVQIAYMIEKGEA